MQQHDDARQRGAAPLVKFNIIARRGLAERAVDLHDLEKRLLRQMLGDRREELTNLTQPVLILAHNLTPSETATWTR